MLLATYIIIYTLKRLYCSKAEESKETYYCVSWPHLGNNEFRGKDTVILFQQSQSDTKLSHSHVDNKIMTWMFR